MESVLVKSDCNASVFLWIWQISKNLTENLGWLHLAVICTYLLSFVVPLVFIRFQLLYFLLILFIVIRCHLLLFAVPLVLIRCTSLPFVVIRFTTRLSLGVLSVFLMIFKKYISFKISVWDKWKFISICFLIHRLFPLKDTFLYSNYFIQTFFKKRKRK